MLQVLQKPGNNEIARQRVKDRKKHGDRKQEIENNNKEFFKRKKHLKSSFKGKGFK